MQKHQDGFFHVIIFNLGGDIFDDNKKDIDEGL
jgi:hypothetical protein